MFVSRDPRDIQEGFDQRLTKFKLYFYDSVPHTVGNARYELSTSLSDLDYVLRAFIVLDADFFGVQRGINLEFERLDNGLGKMVPKLNRQSNERQAALGVANHVHFLVNRLLSAYLPALAGFEKGVLMSDARGLVRVNKYSYSACQNARSMPVFPFKLTIGNNLHVDYRLSMDLYASLTPAFGNQYLRVSESGSHIVNHVFARMREQEEFNEAKSRENSIKQ